MGNHYVEEVIMQYTELVYWNGDEVVGSEHLDDDHEVGSLGSRKPTDQETLTYFSS